jgi:FixJ family two-component response regulator/signal transduction histidine kinase
MSNADPNAGMERRVEAVWAAGTLGLHATTHDEAVSLVAALPVSSGLGFVLFLPEGGQSEAQVRGLLAAHTILSVVPAAAGAPVLPNRLHLAPAEGWLGIEGGILRFDAAKQGGNGAAGVEARFDHFLRALAADEGRHAGAVVLAERPDTPGLAAIRHAGGQVFVAEEASPDAIAQALGLPRASFPGLAAAAPGRTSSDHARWLSSLRHRFLPQVLKEAPDRPIRIWIVGCGTGEEAYAVAAMVLEACVDAGTASPPAIFATDADAAAIARAREGICWPDAAFHVVQDALDPYLGEAEHGGWRVAPELRKAVVFGVLDPLRDPPFPSLDLIVHHGPLADLPPAARLRVLGAFHGALRPSGLLILGGPMPDRLAEAGLAPIFLAQISSAPVSTAPGAYRRLQGRPNGTASGEPFAPEAAAELAGLARQVAVEAFVPPSLLVDAVGWVVGTIGAVERFADISKDVPGGWLLAVTAPWLRHALAQAVAEARLTGGIVCVPASDPSADLSIDLRVQVLERQQGLLLVSFQPVPAGTTGATFTDLSRDAVVAGQQLEIEALHRELEAARGDLVTARLAMELSQEEATSVQEEMAATRDELTSRNAELAATNFELRRALQHDRHAARELRSILDGSGIATIFLDRGLNIRFFTSSPRLPFRIIANDIGRPLADIAPVISDPGLLDEARMVLATLEPRARELQDADSTWLLRRIHPVVEGDAVVSGVAITYADISETKAAALHAEAKQSLTADIVRTLGRPLVVLDTSLHVVFANEPFRALFGPADENALRLLVGPTLRTAPPIAAFLTSRDDAVEKLEDCVVQAALPGLGPRTLRVGACRMPPARTLLVVEDITDRVQLITALENARTLAERTARERSRLLAAAAQDLRRSLQEVTAPKGQPAGASGPAVPAARGEAAAIRRMAAVLDALQDGAQLDLGILQPSFAAFSVGPLLAGLERDAGDVARAVGLQWRVVGCDRPVLSDPRLLRQVLRHLIAVLLRHMPRGRILVGCRRRGDRLRLEVWGSGLQLSSPLLRAIFEEPPDGQPRTEGDEAFRLGLDVARRLAELLGHPIRIETRAGGEPVFLIDLPAGMAAVPTGAAPEMLRPILIVEEALELGGTVRLLLEEDGYAVMVATDAAQAMALALEHPPALVIASHGPPGGANGLDLVRRIAGALEDRPPAVILLSGDLFAPALKEIAAADFEHAPRNIEPAALLERVRRRVPRLRPLVAAPEGGLHGHVFIVEDDTELRHGIAEWLRSLGWHVETFASAQEFLEADTPERRGCVLADWGMTGLNGMELLNALRPHADRLPTIMMAGQGDIRLAVSAVSAGAIDFLKKPIHNEALLRSLERGAAMAAAGARQRASRTEQGARLASLTPRQREILDRIIAGAPNKIIAADLNLSQRTVENHRATIMAKLGARSLPELIRIVMASL